MINLIPQLWKDVLFSLTEDIFPDAIIAGGCLRDIATKHIVKDVDIFLEEVDGIDMKYINECVGSTDAKVMYDFTQFKQNKLNSIKHVPNMSWKYLAGYDTENTGSISASHFDSAVLESFVARIVTFTVKGELFELIFLRKDPIDYVTQNFDFRACKIYFDGGQVVKSPSFEKDIANKQFVVDMPLTRINLWRTVTAHYKRLKIKYPDWVLVIEDINIATQDDLPLIKLQTDDPEEEVVAEVPFDYEDSFPRKRSNKSIATAVMDRVRDRTLASHNVQPGETVSFTDRPEFKPYDDPKTGFRIKDVQSKKDLENALNQLNDHVEELNDALDDKMKFKHDSNDDVMAAMNAMISLLSKE